jgi:hypothetical protein
VAKLRRVFILPKEIFNFFLILSFHLLLRTLSFLAAAKVNTFSNYPKKYSKKTKLSFQTNSPIHLQELSLNKNQITLFRLAAAKIHSLSILPNQLFIFFIQKNATQYSNSYYQVLIKSFSQDFFLIKQITNTKHLYLPGKSCSKSD